MDEQQQARAQAVAARVDQILRRQIADLVITVARAEAENEQLRAENDKLRVQLASPLRKTKGDGK